MQLVSPHGRAWQLRRIVKADLEGKRVNSLALVFCGSFRYFTQKAEVFFAGQKAEVFLRGEKMVTEFEAGFSILPESDGEGAVAKGAALMSDVADRIESMLSDGRHGGALPSVEREVSDASGYAVLSADRPHSGDPQHTVRIQARLCTEGEAVTAQIRTRFLSVNDEDPANLTAGPPGILREIVDNYLCEIGAYQFRNEVFRVEDDDTARQVMQFVMNKRRKIPVLVLTENDDGNTAVEPQRVMDYLLGLALVVHFKGDTSEQIREAGARACFNGAMRFYWPGGADDNKFYWPGDPAVGNLAQFQRDCIDNAEIQDLNGDFEQAFSTARTQVIQELHERRAVRAEAAGRETAAELEEARERIADLERAAAEVDAEHSRVVDDLLDQLRAGDAAAGADAGSDAVAAADAEIAARDKEIRKLNTTINQMRRVRQGHEDRIRELSLENQEFAAEVERARDEAAAAVAVSVSAAAETAQDGVFRLTGKSDIDNITILNHAINIYRDPARHYVIRSLSKRYTTGTELYAAIEQTMNSEDDRKRLRRALNEGLPLNGIDVGHLEHIVMDNRACFNEKTRLATKMGEVRHIRNVAAHPEYNGIDGLKARDGINKIASALREMGNNDHEKIVKGLVSHVR